MENKNYVKIFKTSVLVRAAISLLTSKFNIRKVVLSLPDNLRFGVALVLFSYIQNKMRKHLKE